MKNGIEDLNDHLFAQIERLSDEGLSKEDLALEVQRAKSIVNAADQIIRGATLQYKTVRMVAIHGDRFKGQLSTIEKKSGAQKNTASKTIEHKD